MKLTLYFNPESRATIAKWMLDELGDVPYDTVLIDFKKGENKQPDFLKINPAGKLPALVADDGTRLFENVAIALWLAERFPEKKLAPPIDSPNRGRYLSLCVYATSQLEPAMGDDLMKVETSPVRGWTSFQKVEEAIESELGDGPWLLGEQFTFADLLTISMFFWRAKFGSPNRPKIAEYVERGLSRPAAAFLRSP